MKAMIESFLKFTPRVQFRAPDWLFLDIASTSHLFRGEATLMDAVQSLARDLGFESRAAVADTPAAAQAFAFSHGARKSFISPVGDEREHLKDLPLTLLTQLEGLEAWNKPTHIESVISFFMMLGMHSLRDLSRFTLPSFQERWGETGATIWRRLNGSISERSEQVISPLHPTEALEDYMHLDFPVSLQSLLLHELERSLEFLFVRLQGRRLLARKVSLRLRCEYSKTQHLIEIEPQKPSRDQEMFLTLLENKLGKLDLSNPIRDFDFSILPTAEQVQQFDFFEARAEENSKLDTLLNLLAQTRESTQLQAGFYKIQPSTRPEDSWQLCTEPHTYPVRDSNGREVSTSLSVRKKRSSLSSPQAQYGVRQSAKNIAGYGQNHSLNHSQSYGLMSGLDSKPDLDDDECIAPADLGGFAASLPQAPRPTRMLMQPQVLSLGELQKLKILSRNPIERLEDGWWEERFMQRDYYFAVSPIGQCLWIYQNRKTDEYFLHGYFD